MNSTINRVIEQSITLLTADTTAHIGVSFCPARQCYIFKVCTFVEVSSGCIDEAIQLEYELTNDMYKLSAMISHLFGAITPNVPVRTPAVRHK